MKKVKFLLNWDKIQSLLIEKQIPIEEFVKWYSAISMAGSAYSVIRAIQEGKRITDRSTYLIMKVLNIKDINLIM